MQGKVECTHGATTDGLQKPPWYIASKKSISERVSPIAKAPDLIGYMHDNCFCQECTTHMNSAHPRTEGVSMMRSHATPV